MLFNSYVFILIFLPITAIIYFLLNKMKYITIGKIWLVLTSLFFYSYWNIKYIPIILGSIIFNYNIGILLSKKNIKFKKTILYISIFLNLVLLGYYKYYNFFIQNLNYLFEESYNYKNIILPLAISFFTFQQISYLIDSYKNETKEYNFFSYILFVIFFPQLIAGPIVHHKEMMPQFAYKKSKILNYKNIAIGIYIFSIGLFKKVIIADTFSIWAINGFDVIKNLNFLKHGLLLYHILFNYILILVDILIWR